MSITDLDRKRGIDLLVSIVLKEGSNDEKRQIALRLAQRKEHDVFERSKGVLASRICMSSCGHVSFSFSPPR